MQNKGIFYKQVQRSFYCLFVIRTNLRNKDGIALFIVLTRILFLNCKFI